MAQATRTPAIATVKLTYVKETKNTVRYDGPAPISQLYVSKGAFGDVETYPASIVVEVRVAS